MATLNRRLFLKNCGLTAAAILAGCSGFEQTSSNDSKTQRPNIVIILADDMGYSDIGCYGSEIPTPNLDALAANGLRFSQFYNVARCCPTRASLLTGLFPHQAGIGGMTEPQKGPGFWDPDYEGYTGSLNHNCLTIAEALKPAGYHTYMTGKWHLGQSRFERLPIQRGFERFYGISGGACNYFRPEKLMLNNKKIKTKSDYYTTDAFTDYSISFLRQQKDANPFFLYLAYNAPHWPLHAKKEDVDKFVESYNEGWDVIRLRRHQRQKEMGLLKKEWKLTDKDKRVRPWDELSESEKQEVKYRMAVYAAQVHCMDYNIGRVVEELKKQNKLDNTVILFLSDNGACDEPSEIGNELGGGDFSEVNNPEKTGAISYGQGWANVSNTPFKRYKKEVYEGGIATPLIIHWPAVIGARIGARKGSITDSVGYLPDIVPTMLELADASYPKTYNGNKIHALEGRSLVPAFRFGKVDQQEWMFWEHFDSCAVRNSKWKAVRPDANAAWQLYDLESDRTETTNLAQKFPNRISDMAEKWQQWALTHNVFPKPK